MSNLKKAVAGIHPGVLKDAGGHDVTAQHNAAIYAARRAGTKRAKKNARARAKQSARKKAAGG